jgi:chromosome segregation ATPase
MLDTIFRNGGDRKQAQDELRELLDLARSERQALRTMLDQAADANAKLARTHQALDELGSKTERVTQQVELLTGQAARYEERSQRLDQLEQRVGDLVEQAADNQRSARSQAASAGDLERQQQTARELAEQAQQAQAALQAVRLESGQLDALRLQLRESAAAVEQSSQRATTLQAELQALHAAESELRQQMQGLRDLAGSARGDAAAAVQAAGELDGKLERLARLQDLGRDTEQRLSSLNALAEHVGHKARALETQKATVEHAVVEATRLNEMVWAMDAQIAKISDGREQLQRTEETVARMEQLARSTAQELAAATAARDAFLGESTRLQGQGRTLADGLRAAVERLSLDRQEVEAFDQRLKALSAAVGESESRMQAVLARDENIAALQRQADTLSRAFESLTQQAEALARQQLGLDGLAERLAQVDALGARTTARHQSLLQTQQELDTVRSELAAFHTAHAQAAQLSDKLALDRSALESFAERSAGTLSRLPELETRLDAVLGQLAQVEAGNQAAEKLAKVAVGLDQQVTRVAARMQFVELLDQRVNGLHELTASVERQQAEQLARRAEVEGLKNLCDSLGAQLVDVQQKIDGVATAQGRLLPMTAQVALLANDLHGSQQQLQALRQDDAVVREQQARLAELVDQSRQLGAQAAERLRQVQAANDELGRATALKEAVLAELAKVQAGQRDAVAQIDLADDQLQRAEAMTRALEQRRTQLQATEQAIAAFEARLAELHRGSERVDQKIQSLADREALVQAVKTEVDTIREISARSRADLQFVTDHRSAVSDQRARIEELMARAVETDDKMASIQARRKAVEEVQAATGSVLGMLGDIQLNLDMLSEQRAVVDHVGEKLARLDFTVQEAQNTLRALQREREVAERIEQGIKALRGRGAAGAATAG